MEMPTPAPEHEWLMQLVGEWEWEMTTPDGPDGPGKTYRGTESVRALGQVWTIGEMRNTSVTDVEDHSIMTLGFDAAKGKFVGSFVSAMMPDLWIYEGSLDAAKKTLTLDAEGPSFTTPGERAPYKDAIEIVDRDHKVMTSRTPGENGEWTTFMTMRYTRVRG